MTERDLPNSDSLMFGMDRPAATTAPLTVVSGFLGSGKTTLINRVLGGAEGRRLAVLVNEFGDIGIDGTLLRGRGGDILELAGGCVCCQIGDDLRQATLDLIEYARPDHVLLETTGVAEPDQVLEQLAAAPSVAVVGLVCAVDAAAVPVQLERRPEVAHQILAADRLLVTKVDRATPAELAAAHAALDALGSHAERAAFPPGRDDALLAGWLLAPRPAAGRAHAHTHGHAEQLVAAAVPVPGALLEGPLRQVLGRLVGQAHRVKGFVRLHGEDAPALVELAGDRVEIRRHAGHGWDELGGAGALVVIGEAGLDEAALRRQLAACAVTAG